MTDAERCPSCGNAADQSPVLFLPWGTATRVCENVAWHSCRIGNCDSFYGHPYSWGHHPHREE